MSHEVKVGLIGYGYAGRTFHAPVLQAVPGLKLAKVVERHGNDSKERYPHVEVVKSAVELFRDPSIDLVVLTTPSTQHLQLAEEALNAGKHVVVEKPFTVTSAEADHLITLASKADKMLSVFHNRRWDGDFLTIQSIIRQGLLGKLSRCEFRWEKFRPVVNPARWRENGEPGSGTFYDLGVHFLDQALTLFGLPFAIRAEIEREREGAEADDYFDVTLQYDNDLKVTLKSSMQVRREGPRYALHGSRGSYIKFGLDPQEDALKCGLDPSAPAWGEETPANWGELLTRVDDLTFNGRIETLPGAYQAYYQNIHDSLTGQAELAVKASEARNAVRLIELAYQSSRERRTVEVTV